jgi:hypothetical protein
MYLGYMWKEGGRRGMLEMEATYKAEYLNTKYKGDQFVNIVQSHESTIIIVMLQLK